MEKIKKFFAELKNDVKSPVKTPEEATARKKKFGKLALYCVAGIVGFGALSLIPVVGGVFTVFVIISGLCAAFCGFMWFVANKISKKFKDIFCEKCNTRIVYGDNVSFDVLGKRNVQTSSSSGNHAEAQLKEYTKVKINCTCQNCGAEKSFEHEFCTNIIKADSRHSSADSKARPIEGLVKNYFGDNVEIGY